MEYIKNKLYNKLVSLVLIVIMMMTVLMSCSPTPEKLKEEISKLEIEKQEREWALKLSDKALKKMEGRFYYLKDKIKELEIIDQGRTPIYCIEIHVKHVRKHRHVCKTRINVSKEEYDKLKIGSKLNLYGERPETFELIVINKEII